MQPRLRETFESVLSMFQSENRKNSHRQEIDHRQREAEQTKPEATEKKLSRNGGQREGQKNIRKQVGFTAEKRWSNACTRIYT